MITQPEYQGNLFLDACLPGQSDAMRDMKDCIVRLNAQADEVRSILLLGETGVGKTYIARVVAMHRCWTKRLFLKTDESLTEREIADELRMYVRTRGAEILHHSGDPFRQVNLPTLEGHLARDELFGHEKGAFTGATSKRTGLLGEPTVMDILLDEVGYASLGMQRNLLQLLQSSEFYKIGSNQPERTNARIFFATNQNLHKLVREGKFQEDLWWRLTDHVLYVPPLRDRREEVKLLTDSLLLDLNRSRFGVDVSGYLRLTNSDYNWAESHEWPGNVRELEKTVRRWFFYRGSRSMKIVSHEVARFLPRSTKSTDTFLSIDKDALRKHLIGSLRDAGLGNPGFLSPEALLDDFVQPLRKDVAAILTSCIDELGFVGVDDLARIFKQVKPVTVRSWLARNRR